MKLTEAQAIGGPRGEQLRRIALVSDHDSPLAAPGSTNCGGQNVYVAHLARELAAAGYLVDIFITPVEAMACARPVIGSEVGGIKSTVADGLSGFLIPPRDPQALAARLASLHRKPGLARAKGERGLRRAYQHFTWRIVTQRAAAIYAAAMQEQEVANYPPQESA